MDDLEFINDIELLRLTAEESGLGGSRDLLWPLLCRVDPSHLFEVSVGSHSHQLVDQVDKDVSRSMFLVDKDSREAQRLRLRSLVNAVLDAHLDLSYYQGFHDIASTVLLVCKKPSLSRCVLDRLACGPLRPLLAQDLQLVTGLLSELFPVIGLEDAALRQYLDAAGVQPYFALPWILTWFSHSVSSFPMVLRLFDLFLASDDPAMSFFVSVAIVLWSKPYLAEVECEYSAVHSFYSKLFADIPLALNLDPTDPRQPMKRLGLLVENDLELILARARSLALRHGARLRHPSSRACLYIQTASANAYSHLPVVVVDHLPKRSKQSLAELRYRFEGTLSKRRRRVVARHASRALALAVVVVVVAALVQWFRK